jgi:hypothetical protein
VFCENCGRCLLSSDPEKVEWVTAPPTDYHKTREGIEFYDRHRIKKSRAASLNRWHLTGRSVIVGWLMLLNLLVFILMSEILTGILIR